MNAQTSTSTAPAVVSSSYSSSGSSSSAPSANNNNTNTNSNKPSIKLCTRLNGKHEWKWKVPIDEGFDKVCMSVCIYLYIYMCNMSTFLPYHGSFKSSSILRTLTDLCISEQIRSNLALFYGLNSATAITLVFDGNKLQDSDTPHALEMENDDMIDAKVSDTTLFYLIYYSYIRDYPLYTA